MPAMEIGPQTECDQRYQSSSSPPSPNPPEKECREKKGMNVKKYLEIEETLKR